jgi:arsenite oxidase small subunit
MHSCNRLVRLGRRQFLRGGATAAATTVAASMIPQRADATPALARIAYPSSKLANIKISKSTTRGKSNTPIRALPV